MRPLTAAAFDIRSDKAKAEGYLLEVARKRIADYVASADDATMNDIFQRSGMLRDSDRTQTERIIADLVRVGTVIFFTLWALTAAHMLNLI